MENNQIPYLSLASSVPTVLSLDNGDTLTNHYDIANPYINYFASTAETTKSTLVPLHQKIPF